jgi:hypothetical protein
LPLDLLEHRLHGASENFKYVQLFSAEVVQSILMTSLLFLSIDPEMYVWSSSWSFLGHHATHPLASKITTIAA